VIERLPCKPAPASPRILIEWVAFWLSLAAVLYLLGV
jgi:hypothetical protein